MISVTFVITPGQAAVEVQAAPAAPQARPSAAEIREQVRASIEAARASAEAARASAQAAGHQDRVTIGPEGIIVNPQIPGEPTVVVGPRDMRNVIPQQAVDIAIGFFIMVAVMVVGWPIARAFGRRIERRGQIATLDSGTMEQLQRIEQAVDAMAIEVERISESQRFMARLQRESSQALPGMESR